MEELRLGDQLALFDRGATVAAYKNVSSGGAEECGCSGCRNFAVQRESAYPVVFKAILSRLGIDADKEGEAYEMGPSGDGRRLYGGWFYFVGELAEKGERLTELDDGFQCYFREARHLPAADPAFGTRVAALEFVTKARWVLEENPPR